MLSCLASWQISKLFLIILCLRTICSMIFFSYDHFFSSISFINGPYTRFLRLKAGHMTFLQSSVFTHMSEVEKRFIPLDLFCIADLHIFIIVLCFHNRVQIFFISLFVTEHVTHQNCLPQAICVTSMTECIHSFPCDFQSVNILRG